MNTAIQDHPPAWISRIEKLINKILKMDEEIMFELGKFKQKVIGFQFIHTRLTVFLFLYEDKIKMRTRYDEKPNVIIKGTPINFLMMLFNTPVGATGIPPDLQIIGDVGLAQNFQKLMQSLEIDLEEPLSKWVGDPVAYQLGKLVRAGRRFLFNTGKILATDISEYLRFEVEMLPDDLLVEEFCQEVDKLRDDTDRVEQRACKLKSQTGIK